MNALFSFSSTASSENPNSSINFFVSRFDQKIKTAQELAQIVDWLVANFNFNSSEYKDNFFSKFFPNTSIPTDILPFCQTDYQLEGLQPTLIFVIDNSNETLKLAFLPKPEIYFLEPNQLLHEDDHIDIRTLFANLESPENALTVYFDQATKELSEVEIEKTKLAFDQISDKLAVYDTSTELSKEAIENLDQAYSNALQEIVKGYPDLENLNLLELEYLFLYPGDTRNKNLSLLTDDFQELLVKTSRVNKRILKNYKILHEYLSIFGKYYEFILNEEKFTQLLEDDYNPESDPFYNSLN